MSRPNLQVLLQGNRDTPFQQSHWFLLDGYEEPHYHRYNISVIFLQLQSILKEYKGQAEKRKK